MRVKFNANLGADDAKACNLTHHTSLDHKQCTAGAIVDLPDDASEFLAERYKGLFETVDRPSPKIKAVPQSPAIGSTDKNDTK